MDLVLDVHGSSKQFDSILPAANKSSQLTCPVCQSSAVKGIFIEPLSFDDIERAIALKKYELSSLGMHNHYPQKEQSRKHPREEDREIQAESPYLLLSNSNPSISCSGLSKGKQRTGRWTNEETALVEFLMTHFDQGLLTLPHGIKLNEFLGDLLLCKSSRLTKKMKNTKLSTRSFVLGKSCTLFTTKDCKKLSMLQESFLSSTLSEFTRSVLKLNLSKQWRTHFYNICLQVGYPYVEEKAWSASLRELEKRASRAEEVVRSIRRRNMGRSLQYDSSAFVIPNPVFNNIEAVQPRSDPNISHDLGTATASIVRHDPKSRTISTVSVISNEQQGRTISTVSVISNEQKGRTISTEEEEKGQNVYGGNEFVTCSESIGQHRRPRTFSADISISSVKSVQGRGRSFSEDFDALLDDLNEEPKEFEKSSSMKKIIPIENTPKPASIPIVQRSIHSSSRFSPHNEAQTRDYLHKTHTGKCSSGTEGLEDLELAAFLNRNIPDIHNTMSAGQTAPSSDAKMLRPYFLSFRSLLSQPPNERTCRENEIIQTLKRSLKAYLKGNRRDEQELASLLIKDWVFLKSTYAFDDMVNPYKTSNESEAHHLPITSMSTTPVQSTAVESPRPVLSIHSIGPTCKQFTSDNVEKPAN